MSESFHSVMYLTVHVNKFCQTKLFTALLTQNTTTIFILKDVNNFGNPLKITIMLSIVLKYETARYSVNQKQQASALFFFQMKDFEQSHDFQTYLERLKRRKDVDEIQGEIVSLMETMVQRE